jgi:hypothetical protein
LKDKGDQNGLFYNLAEIGSEIGALKIQDNQAAMLLPADESRTGSTSDY